MAAIKSQEQDVNAIVCYIQAALNECGLSNVTPRYDSAFLLLASQLALATGTDHPAKMDYRKHLDVCAEEIMNDITALQTPTNIN